MIRPWSAAALAGFTLALSGSAAAGATLETALARALDRHPQLHARDAAIDASRARAVRAGAWPSPMIEAGIVNVPTNGRFDEDPMTMKMVGVVQRVPVFGANRIARRAAEQAVHAGTEERAALRREIMGAVWDAWAEAHGAAERRRIAEGHGDEMRRMIAAARARYESGRGRLDDVLRSGAEAARVLADVETFRAEEAVARARLAALTDLPADSAALEAPPSPETLTELATWRAALEDHPRLAAWSANERRWQLSARAARRMAWPDLELRASYGFREPLAAGHGVAGVQKDMYSAMAGVMLPLFAGSRELAEGREMDAMAREAAAERAATALELERALATAHARAVASASTTRLVVETILPAQRRTLQAAWSAYEAGTADLLRVLDVAHELYQQELALAVQRRTLAGARGELVALTGRTDLAGIALPAPGATE